MAKRAIGGRAALTGADVGRWAAMAFFLLAVAGCATPVARDPVPPERYFKARVAHFPTARFYGDKPLPDHAFDLDDWRTHRLPVIEARAAKDGELEGHILLLSGGGADGAFGAGLLNGWTAHGDRPEFEIVTGVSIGALMAPYAFLGPAYDARLAEMFLNRSGIDDIVEFQFFAALGGALSVGDSTPLARLIERHVDEALLDAVAVEHAKGRRLFVGTTNLDSRRPIIWNMGEIASSDRPERLELFRDVLRASSSVPGLAPPVYIDVELDGARYQEMHVDGGVMNSIVLAAPSLTRDMRREQFGEITPTIWIIQNNKLRASYGPTRDSFSDVLGVTVSELIRSQSRGDHSRLYLVAEREGVNYRLAAVPRSFEAEGGDDFDPTYLRLLYEEGARLARSGYPWRTAPPSIERLDLVDQTPDPTPFEPSETVGVLGP